MALLVLPVAVCAQSGVAAVDSAAVARASWARALSALRAGDVTAAQRESARAAEAWPVQPVYLWGRALISARARDSASVRRALSAYAALGLGRNPDDTTFAFVANSSWFETLSHQLAVNGAPLARSRVIATLPDSTFWPEGMDYDARARRFYLASVRHGTIAELSETGDVRDLLKDAGLGSVLGVRIDAVRRVLWATVSDVAAARRDPALKTRAALVKIDPTNGKVLRKWELPDSERGHTLGDLVIGSAGDVFVSDSDEPFVYRLRPNADSLERMTHPLFRSLQGLAVTTDTRTLYVADYSHGLLRINLRDGSVALVGAPMDVTTVGLDGIVLHENAIIGVQNGIAPARIMRFELDASGRRVIRAKLLDRNSTIADEPTIGAVRGNEFVYVATSQWERYRPDGSRTALPLHRPVLLAVPLR